MENNNIFSRENYPNLTFWGVCFILFLPIIILPPNFQPSDWTRVILFKITLTILISFFLYRFFYLSVGRQAKQDMPFSLPKRGLLFYLPVLALFAYFIVLSLSTIFSQDLRFSIFGSPPRAGGILNLLFFLIFAVFISIFIKGGLWDKLIKINFIAGVLASLLAIVQYFGLFKNVFLGFETGATPSFLGNSTFLAIYMIFLVFSSFNFFLLENDKKKKLAYAGLFLLFLFTIFVAGSRASYLAIFAGFAFYFLFFPIKLASSEDKLINWISIKRLKIFKIISALLILLALMALIYVNISPKLPDFIENNEKLSYFIHNRLSFKIVAQDLAGTRLSAWKITLKAIKERPILGWGPENFHIGFEKYFDPTLPPTLQRLWWDRPHNIFLEVFVNSGIFALIFYIAFWVILLWQLQIVKVKNDDSKNVQLAHNLQAMFIGYLVALFFNFDSFPTYLISFFFIGYAFYLISLNQERKTISPPVKYAPLKKPAVPTLSRILDGKAIGTFTFLAVIILFFWFWNIKPLYLNEKVVFIKNLSEAKQCKKALAASNNSNWAKTGIIRPYAILTYSDIIKNCTFAEPQKEVEYSKRAVSLLKIASDMQPKFSRTWFFMGAFGNILGAREENKENKNKLLSEARNYLYKAIELSPKRQEFFIEVEKNYMLAENYEAMVKLAESCINIDPTVGECYWYLGIAQIFMGNQETGKKNIKLSKEKNYNDPSYLQLGVAFISQKNYKDAADAYSILTSIHPDNVSYHATLAILYKEIKNYERARMEAMRVFELQPENPKTIQFIQVLLGLNPNDIYLHSSLASIYKQLGRKEEMKKELLILVFAYQQFIYKNPKSADNHFDLAVIYEELGEYEKSFKEALTAINLSLSLELNEKIESFIINRLPEGAKWLEKENKEKVKQELLKVKSTYLQLIANRYDVSDYHFKLAGVYQELGEYENSFKEAVIALKLAPEQEEKIESFIINRLPEGAKWLEKQ